MKKKRILVLDDEELILELVTEFLQLLGLEVETAATGRKAIEKFKNAIDKKEPFSLVILDITLPEDMDGAEVLKEIKKIDPGIKAIVSTGYNTSDIMSDPRAFGFDAAIPKPFSLNKLKEVLNELLNQA